MTEQERQARMAFFLDHTQHFFPWWIILLVSILFFVISMWVVYKARFSKNVRFKRFAVILVGLWTLGLPAWFLLEYSLIAWIPKEPLPDIEGFKYTQELARNFWIAGLAVLVGLYQGKLPGARD